MLKRKIILGVTAGLLGAFALAGAAFAQESPVDGQNPRDSIKDRVAEILGIDRETLNTTMSAARNEHREAKKDERLAALVQAGTIIQEQADEIDAWEDSKPEFMDNFKSLARDYGGVKSDLEANLATLVDQEIITQSEADEMTAWAEAKPHYLNDLREELKGERDGKGHRGRHKHGRHHRIGPDGNGHGGGYSFQQHIHDAGTGTSFTLPNG